MPPSYERDREEQGCRTRECVLRAHRCCIIRSSSIGVFLRESHVSMEFHLPRRQGCSCVGLLSVFLSPYRLRQRRTVLLVVNVAFLSQHSPNRGFPLAPLRLSSLLVDVRNDLSPLFSLGAMQIESRAIFYGAAPEHPRF